VRGRAESDAVGIEWGIEWGDEGEREAETRGAGKRCQAGLG
jgi:hypothetical protein